MTIPRGVNQIEFYYKAKEKGITISSIYKGVVAAKIGNKYPKIYWIANENTNGKTAVYGHFPLTEQGEYKAHLAYIRKKINKGNKSSKII